ncbi:glutaminase A [Tropicimonas sp. IMCC6043]|uniref:glutaminase A n=1 Tax=Tropicimonas sp. IMCC6043 TaxID=2510645 RepID=UPI0013E9BA1C|nr:glutaminase A [Tropicimonas sp. IMCC6043]
MTFDSRNMTYGQISPVEGYLQDLYESVAAIRDGALADYIPELARADPDDLAITVATVDGAVYSVGRADRAFTIQSVSKPFMFGYALQAHGRDRVMQKVGVEPTGDPFNSILLDDLNNRPFNPMVNAGAIAMTELLQGTTPAEREAAQMSFFSRFAGRTLEMDERVYRSESETGHRNRAIAYMMLNSGMIEGPTEELLDLYFRQCSILVTARDLAVMAATLAAHGRNPLSGEQVISPGNVRDVLSVMATCGMYDYAGQWMFDVGLPAKSGVSGAIIAVLPGQIGMAVYSPLVDRVGNSVRGIEVCRRFTRDFSLHAYVDRTDTRSVVRRIYRGGDVTSNRVRSRRETDVIRDGGTAIVVVEAQGPLFFGTAEQLIRRAADAANTGETCRVVILDLERLSYADRAARVLLRQFAHELAARSTRLVFTGVGANPDLGDFSDAFAVEIAKGSCSFVVDIDRALEAEENALLAEHGLSHGAEKLSLADMELFEGLAREDIAALESVVLTFEFKAGETILRIGDIGQVFFIVARGAVSITLGDPDKPARRIASVGPGQSFGEMALLDGGRRSANVRADTPVLAYGLAVEEVRRLSVDGPQILETILSNIVRSLSNRLRAANDQINALE